MSALYPPGSEGECEHKVLVWVWQHFGVEEGDLLAIGTGLEEG